MEKIGWVWWAFFVLLLVTANALMALAQTPLADTAAQMKAGEWKQLSTLNINPTFAANGASKITLGYTEFLHWDSQGHRAYYLGSDHNNTNAPLPAKFIQFDEQSNTWSELPSQSWMNANPSAALHGYDHGAINVADRFFYWRKMTTQQVYRWHLDNRVWDLLPLNKAIGYNSCCVGLAYFPERHSIIWASLESGTLGTAVEYREATATWARFEPKPTLNFTNSNYQHFAEYNPIHKLVLFGGGMPSSVKVYQLSQSGMMASVPDAPLQVAVNASINTVDPVSGEHLFLFKSGQFWKLDMSSGLGAWSQLPSPPSGVLTTKFNNGVFGLIAGPINSYGVVMIVSCNGQNACVTWLYKHAGSKAEVPKMPSNVKLTQ